MRSRTRSMALQARRPSGSSWLLALSSLVLVLAGCPDDLPPGACNSDADCPIPGHACIGGTCQEVSTVCSGDGDCGFGERCIDRECVPDDNVCQRDTDCPDGQRCDVSSGRCVADECRGDDDCEGDEVCRDGECRPPDDRSCVFDPDCSPPHTICEDGECVDGCLETGCPSGQSCNPNTGRCEEQETCDSDDDCDPPETICEDDECIPGCTPGSCPLESHCDTRTGRCVPGCTADAHCGPPERICEGGDCVDGCISTGCEAGYTCDTNTGRCTPDAGCIDDSDCSPPATICDDGDCVPGCTSTGCGYEEHCDSMTGRCEPGCQTDSDCDPPTTICDGGSCVEPPNCLEDGCPANELCSFETGLCEPKGTVPLGQSCNDGSGNPDHSVCESDFCAPMESPGPICSSVCTTTADCPTGFGCMRLHPTGAYLCLPWSETTGAGAYCTEHEDCRSAICHESECHEVCQHDSDCPSTSDVCKVVLPDDEMHTACASPEEGGITGSSCEYLNDCRHFLCVGGRCAEPCHTSVDCPIGFVCGFVTDGVDWIRACVFADGDSTGHAPAGNTCDPETDEPCRSLWCVSFDDDDESEGHCVDYCGTQDDCPVGFRCTILVLGEDDSERTAPLCIPR